MNRRVLGCMKKGALEIIWQNTEYMAVRVEAKKGECTSCWSCTSAPCADLVNVNFLDMHDCYGNQLSCGHCMWNVGWLICLQSLSIRYPPRSDDHPGIAIAMKGLVQRNPMRAVTIPQASNTTRIKATLRRKLYSMLLVSG